jgi:hypothetical protein
MQNHNPKIKTNIKHPPSKGDYRGLFPWHHATCSASIASFITPLTPLILRGELLEGPPPPPPLYQEGIKGCVKRGVLTPITKIVLGF